MNTGYLDFICTVMEEMISSVKRDEKKIRFIKHYNTFEITKYDADMVSRMYPQYDIFYRCNYNTRMVNPYDPFLSIIKDMFDKYYCTGTSSREECISEFLDKCGVYSLHKSIFMSYMTNNLCKRKEEILLGEVAYETERFCNSMADILTYITKEHPIIVLIDSFKFSDKSTLRLVNKIYDSNSFESNIYMMCTYNDLSPVINTNTDVWNTLIEKLENDNNILDGNVFHNQLEEKHTGDFYFRLSDVPDYITKLTNMFYCLDFDQAIYYMEIIYQKIELDNVEINPADRFSLLKLYAYFAIYSDDITKALLICDALYEIYKKTDLDSIKYDYFYILGLTQTYNRKLSKARECAHNCKELSEKMGDEFLVFKAEMLEVMSLMSGWHNIFFCTNNIEIPDKVISMAEKYNYTNHLAYIYVFAYENDFSLYNDVDGIEDRLVYFSKGIDLAKKLDNVWLLRVAYRKCIMISSSHGSFEITNFYYKKTYDVVGDSDPFETADIFKGLGYTCCATEQYQMAHNYYDKALDIYYDLNMADYIGETLYNMSINCIMSDEYQQAYDYLQTCLKIINSLHLNDMRVCNISKIFGLLALCSYNLGMIYNCQLYLDYTAQFLSHILYSNQNNEIENLDLSFTACDDDLYLFYYVSGKMAFSNKEYSKALVYYDNAQIYMLRSVGNQFFSYVQLKLARAELFRAMGDNTLANEEIESARKYSEEHGTFLKTQKILYFASGQKYVPIQYKLTLSNHTLEDINVVIKQAAINKDFQTLKKRMNFLNIWQKITSIDDKTNDELIDSAMNSIAINFNIDSILYIKYTKYGPVIGYNNSDITLDKETMNLLTKYFENHRSGFVVSKLDKNYKEYSKIISLFNINKVCSIICIPFFVNEKIDSLFISYILMKDNWSSPLSKYILDESDLDIFTLIFKQLTNAIKMLDNQNQIKEINKKLSDSSITDYLTTLYNRDGFYSNVDKLIEDSKKTGKQLDLSILYVDLDNFKYYNDSFGHYIGDLLLKSIANILIHSAGDNGFAVRFGGDEFLITLKTADKDIALGTAKKVLDTIISKHGYAKEIGRILEKDVDIPPEKIVTASIGVATIPNVQNSDDIADALKRADDTLYSIKHKSKCDYALAPDKK